MHAHLAGSVDVIVKDVQMNHMGHKHLKQCLRSCLALLLLHWH